MAFPRRHRTFRPHGTHERTGHRLPWPLHDRATRASAPSATRRSPSPKGDARTPRLPGHRRRRAPRDHQQEPAPDAARARLRPHHPVPARIGHGAPRRRRRTSRRSGPGCRTTPSGGSVSCSRRTSPRVCQLPQTVEGDLGPVDRGARALRRRAASSGATSTRTPRAGTGRRRRSTTAGGIRCGRRWSGSTSRP